MRNFGAFGQADRQKRQEYRTRLRTRDPFAVPGTMGLLLQSGFPGAGRGQGAGAEDSGDFVEEDFEVTDDDASTDEGLPFWAKALIATSVTGVVGFFIGRRAGWF